MLVGCDVISFRSFEEVSIPLVKFEGNLNDTHLYALGRFMRDVVLKAITEDNLKKTLHAELQEV